MKSTDDQGLIQVIVASEADSTYIRAIPTAQAKAGDGSVSLNLGLPPECATSVAAGGKRPEMKDMNGIWNLLSRAIQSLQAYRGVYNASFSTAIGGYPKYALVSDGSGNFWVSTVDQNVTTPGAIGANWQNLFNGYITENAADTRYVLSTGPTNAQSGIKIYIAWPTDETAKSTGYRPLLQVQADYIGALALYADILALQSSKVSKSGDTMTDQLTIATNSGHGINATGQQALGNGIVYSPAIKTGISDTSLAYLQYEFLAGQYARLGILVQDGTSVDEFYLTPDGRIKTFSGKTFAWTSDIPAAPDLSPYALKSSFDSGPITGGYYTRIGNVLTQSFTVSGIQPGNTITIPISLSGNPVSITTAPNSGGNTGSDPSTGNWSSTQFAFFNNGQTVESYSFVVVGPVA